MKRKLAVAISLISALGASTVYALGLGEATVKSALNQPLKAEIELLNVKDLGAGEILPGLATREDFLRSGIERVYFLNDLRFNVETDSRGRAIVQLTTKKPVREPYLNFLVEVIWPSGRLLREYSLLIDPPVFAEEKAAKVAPAKTVSTVTPAARPAQTSTAAPAATRTTKQTSRPVEGTFGPTSNSDTLWAIALQVRPNSSVSPQQTMLALQDLNPDAFFDGNINKLRSGHVLRIPTLEQIKSRTNRQAVNEVVAQNRAFETGQLAPQTVDARPDALVAKGKPSREVTGDELKLVVPRTQQEAAKAKAHAGEQGGAGDEAVRNELIATQERLDKSRLEKEELGNKVKDLEEQMQTLKRLLSLKDDQLAAMQAQMSQLDSAETAKPQGVDVASVAGTTPPVQATDPSTSPESTESAAQPGDGQTASVPAVQPQSVSTPGQAGEPPAQPVMTPAPATPVAPTAPAPAVESWFDKIVNALVNNPLYQGLAAGFGLLVVLLLWVVSRNNARKEQEFHELMAQGGYATVDDQDVLNLGDAAVDNAAQGISRNFDDEGSDALTDAGAYIAYGRFDQAASLLENAIAEEPRRSDLRLKLLEVHAKQGNATAFETQYRGLAALRDEPALEQAAKLRAGLGAEVAGEDDSVSLDDLESQLRSESFGTKKPAVATASARRTEASEPAAIADSAEILDSSEALEDASEIDSLSQKSLESSRAKSPAPAAPEVDLDDLDVDLDFGEIDAAMSVDATDAVATDIQFNLDESLLEDQEAAAPPAPTKTFDLGLDDLALDGSAVEEGMVDTAKGTKTSSPTVKMPADDFEDMDLEAELASLTNEEAAEAETEEPTAEDLLMAEADFGGQTPEEMLASIDEDLGLGEFAGDLSQESEDNLFVTADASDLGADGLDVDTDLDLGLDALVQEEPQPEDLGALPVAELEEVDAAASAADSASVARRDELDSELEGDDDFEFLSGTDEAATKLDLARAYIDMGDVDGARDILEEVSLEGSDLQKQEALSLLKSIA